MTPFLPVSPPVASAAGARPGVRLLLLAILAALPAVGAAQDRPAADDPGLILEGEVLADPQAGTGPTGELTGIEAAEVGVLKLWFDRLQMQAAGDAGGATQAVLMMEALMDREGIRGMEVLAGAFAHEGFDHLDAGNYLRAGESFQLAMRFDPGLPSAYFGLAKARRLSGEGIAAYLQESLRGLRAAATNFWWSYMKLTNAMFLLLVSLAAFGCLFALVMTARHHARWRHDLQESLRQRGLSEPLAKLFSLAAFLAPLLVWLSGVWVLLYWTAGTFRYQSRSEKWISGVMVGFTIIAAPALGFLLSAYRVTDSDTLKATVSALQGGYEPEKVKYIREILKERPNDPTFHFLMASILKDGGYFLEAYEHYKTVIELEPDNHLANNNVGNIYFAMGQQGEAVKWYRKTTELDPEFAIGYFNMSLAQKEQLHFPEGDASLERARTLDADAVAAYLDRTGQEASTTPVDAKLSWSEAWFEMVRGRGAATERAPAAASHIGWLNPITVGGALTWIAMAGLLITGRKRTWAQRCPRCGRAFCSRCVGEESGIELCAGCTNLFLKREELEPEVRQEKQQQVARHELRSKLIPRLAAVVLPGSAQLLAGHAIWGTVLAFLWLVPALWLLLGPRLLGFAGTPYVGPGTVGLWLGLGLMGLVWALGNLVGIRRLATAG